MLYVDKEYFTSLSQLWKDTFNRIIFFKKVGHDVCQLRKNPQIS